jgi:hypothetical protein
MSPPLLLKKRRVAIFRMSLLSIAFVMIVNFFVFQPAADVLRNFFNLNFEGVSFMSTKSREKNFLQLEDQFNQWNFDQRMAVFQPGVGTPICWDARNGFSFFLSSFKDDLDFATNRSDPESISHAWKDTSRDLVFTERMCTAAIDFQRAGSRKKHVAFMHFNENWGAFSGQVANRTVQWGSMTSTFGDCVSYDQIMNYLNHPNTRAVVTSQFQGMSHPKVHSIPLGLSGSCRDAPGMRQIVNRTQLLMVNFNPSPTRTLAIESVMRNFNGSVTNTYGQAGQEGYISELLRSKFVLSPSGMGWDCYRHWEALVYGAIPVIEHYNRTDGWYRVFDGLPVLWVSSFDEVTPELLVSEYARIAQLRNYTFEELSSEYWIDFVHSLRGRPHFGWNARDTEDEMLSQIIALRIASGTSRDDIDTAISNWHVSIRKNVYDLLEKPAS